MCEKIHRQKEKEAGFDAAAHCADCPAGPLGKISGTALHTPSAGKLPHQEAKWHHPGVVRSGSFVKTQLQVKNCAFVSLFPLTAFSIYIRDDMLACYLSVHHSL